MAFISSPETDWESTRISQGLYPCHPLLSDLDWTILFHDILLHMYFGFCKQFAIQGSQQRQIHREKLIAE